MKTNAIENLVMRMICKIHFYWLSRWKSYAWNRIEFVKENYGIPKWKQNGYKKNHTHMRNNIQMNQHNNDYCKRDAWETFSHGFENVFFFTISIRGGCVFFIRIYVLDLLCVFFLSLFGKLSLPLWYC